MANAQNLPAGRVPAELEKRTGQGVSEYLQAPKRKRKNYVLFALSPQFDPDIASTLMLYAQELSEQISITTAKSLKDLHRLSSRQISLIILDDRFAPRAELMPLIKQLKAKKADTGLPVLFLTDQPHQLIDAYQSHLAAHQELDNYVTYPGLPTSQICARVQAALANGRNRRSRRHQVDLPLRFFLLAKNAFFPGRISDISIHGAMLTAEKEVVFRPTDQLLLHLPIQRMLPTYKGELLKLSARVRRVLIGGNRVGISWEYLSEQQTLLLTDWVNSLINNHILRAQATSKLSGRRSNEPK